MNQLESLLRNAMNHLEHLLRIRDVATTLALLAECRCHEGGKHEPNCKWEALTELRKALADYHAALAEHSKPSPG